MHLVNIRLTLKVIIRRNITYLNFIVYVFLYLYIPVYKGSIVLDVNVFLLYFVTSRLEIDILVSLTHMEIEIFFDSQWMKLAFQ